MPPLSFKLMIIHPSITNIHTFDIKTTNKIDVVGTLGESQSLFLLHRICTSSCTYYLKVRFLRMNAGYDVVWTESV